jgi:hypothetical protein
MFTALDRRPAGHELIWTGETPVPVRLCYVSGTAGWKSPPGLGSELRN